MTCPRPDTHARMCAQGEFATCHCSCDECFSQAFGCLCRACDDDEHEHMKREPTACECKRCVDDSCTDQTPCESCPYKEGD